MHTSTLLGFVFLLFVQLVTSEIDPGDPQCAGATDPNGDGVATVVAPGTCDVYYECDSLNNLLNTVYCCGRKVINEACSVRDCSPP